MIDVGDSEVVQESTRETLFKGRYFVSGRDIGSGSSIAKRFKDPAFKGNGKTTNHLCIVLVTLYT